MDKNFAIVSSMTEPNTFFLFRGYHLEIKFTVVNRVISINEGIRFTDEEWAFINENM